MQSGKKGLREGELHGFPPGVGGTQQKLDPQLVGSPFQGAVCLLSGDREIRLTAEGDGQPPFQKRFMAHRRRILQRLYGLPAVICFP